MNRARRKMIAEAHHYLMKATEILDLALEEEQEAFDNMPESFQYGEKGERMEEFIGLMEDAKSEAESMEESLNDILDS